jgi:hypothetical protein
MAGGRGYVPLEPVKTLFYLVSTKIFLYDKNGCTPQTNFGRGYKGYSEEGVQTSPLDRCLRLSDSISDFFHISNF